jgi:poly(3-hydroxybutyrate) depolymerase
MTPGNVDRMPSSRKKRVVRRVLTSDPGQEYFVYVPRSGGKKAPLFVAVHGISRNAPEHADWFSRHAEDYGVVLVAPLFSKERNSDYQRLGRTGRGTRADEALHAIVEEAVLLTGASGAQIHLFGYSGGAQFAHRYAMAYPHRIARAVVVSAGWYTFPDRKERYPYGIRHSDRIPRLRFDPEEFLRVPVAVMVGERDDARDGVRQTARVDRQQGSTRIERARRWVEAMQAAAAAYQLKSHVTFEAIPGGTHSFKQLMQDCQLGERVFRALFGFRFAGAEGAGDHDPTQAG